MDKKTITSAIEELGAEPGISETDMRAVGRKRMADIKDGHETKKQQIVQSISGVAKEEIV